MFRSGQYEVIVGRKLVRQHSSLRIGASVKIGSKSLNVVGVFSDAGSVSEGEVWLDRPVLIELTTPATGLRDGNLSSSLRIRSPRPDLQNYLTKILREEATSTENFLTATTEKAFLRSQGQDLERSFDRALLLVGTFMGGGAIFGAILTMYGVVARRGKEIATLRAIGFGRGAISASVVSEALILSFVGSVMAYLVALPILWGFSISTFNPMSNSEVSIGVSLGPKEIVMALGFALFMGSVSSILPCVKSLRIPVAQGLRG
jgi:putative ABC transport system permease protein